MARGSHRREPSPCSRIRSRVSPTAGINLSRRLHQAGPLWPCSSHFPTNDRETEELMNITRAIQAGIAGACALLFFEVTSSQINGQRGAAPTVKIGLSDIGGTVTSSHGPEAGVWVIAETTDLPTRFTKIVVTDDRGRYVVPDLPSASYDVWVRGFGLIDSPKVKTTPGKLANLTSVIAPSLAAAAEYYPAIYWFSMLRVPQKSEFPLEKIS